MVAEQFGEAIEMEAITRAAKYGRMTGEIMVRGSVGVLFCIFRHLSPHGVPHHGWTAQDCHRLPGRLRGVAGVHCQRCLHIHWEVRKLILNNSSCLP